MMRFFEIVSEIVRVLSSLFWRTAGLILFVLGLLLILRELSLLGQTEEIDTMTEISVRLGMSPSAGILLLISVMGIGLLCMMAPPIRRRLARR